MQRLVSANPQLAERVEFRNVMNLKSGARAWRLWPLLV